MRRLNVQADGRLTFAVIPSDLFSRPDELDSSSRLTRMMGDPPELGLALRPRDGGSPRGTIGDVLGETQFAPALHGRGDACDHSGTGHPVGLLDIHNHSIAVGLPCGSASMSRASTRARMPVQTGVTRSLFKLDNAGEAECGPADGRVNWYRARAVSSYTARPEYRRSRGRKAVPFQSDNMAPTSLSGGSHDPVLASGHILLS